MGARAGRRSRSGAGGAAALALVCLTFLLSALPLNAGADSAAYPPVTGSITGPTSVGELLKATYTIQANGGPAELTNGSQTGIYSYKAGFGPGVNTTAALITPAQGVLVNRTIQLQFQAPNLTETLTIYALVTSSGAGQNASQNFTISVQIVAPYRLLAVLTVTGPAGTLPFSLTVTLDGQPVGSVAIPTLSSGAHYPLNFAYVAQNLAPGWHTLAISLAQEHGLVAFSGGRESVSQSFYVTGPTPDYSLWYLTGAVALVGAVFIWATRVGARRRGKPKK